MKFLALFCFIANLSALSTARAALPPHYEDARVMSFALTQSAGAFRSTVQSIQSLEKGEYRVTTKSGCDAIVKVVYGEQKPGIIGPTPLKEIRILEKECN